MERSLKLKENEINSLQDQLNAKALSLDEAIKEIELLQKEHNSEETEKDRQQQQIEELSVQVCVLYLW